MNDQELSLDELAFTGPSAELLNRAGALFRQRQQRGERRERISAELQFDSWEGMARGVRGVANDRQLLFQQDDCDLDMQIMADGEQFMLIGQLVADEPLMGTELLMHSDLHDPQGRIADELGRFTFSGLQAGRYLLAALLPNHDLIMEFEIQS